MSQLPAPPAYSEREFETKCATAVHVSLHTPQPTPEDNEEWEEWDESAFDAAARRDSFSSGRRLSRADSVSAASSTSGGSSHRALPATPAHRGQPSVIRPLNIHKKTRSTSSSATSSSATSTSSSAASNGPEKPRPSWYDDAGLGPSSSSASSSVHVQRGPSFVVHNASEADAQDDDEEPPPPFSAVGPSLDGPPFEEHDPLQRTPQPPPVIRMQQPPVARGPAPPPPPPPLRSPTPPTARMNFNPSVAYGKTRNTSSYADAPTPQPIQSSNAAAFYNSSVAPHLAPSTPQRPSYSQRPRSAMGSPTSLYGSSPSLYKRESFSSMPAPVAPVPTYPAAAMRPRIPSAVDLSHYAPSHSQTNPHDVGRWATSEQQLSNFFR